MTSTQANEVTGSAADPARDFLEFWRNYFEQTAIQTRILLESMQGGKLLDQAHSQWLGSLSQSFDSFMRTPAFLDLLKQSLKRMIDLKLLQDQMAQAAAQRTGLPLAVDVVGVLERVQSAEHTILKQLAAMDDRLKAIEKTLSSSATEKKHEKRTSFADASPQAGGPGGVREAVSGTRPEEVMHEGSDGTAAERRPSDPD
jgi:hypothetical protein